MKSQGTFLQIAAVPVVDNSATDIVRGVIAIAYPISTELLTELKELTGNDIALVGLDANAETAQLDIPFTTRPDLREELAAILKLQPLTRQLAASTRPVEFNSEIRDEDFLGVLMPCAAHGGTLVGAIAAFGSTSEVRRPFDTLIRRSVLLGVSVLLCGILVAYWIAHQISSPIVQLAAVTDEIAHGHFPQAFATDGADEIGMLRRAVARMAQSLRKKEELEAYLGSFADQFITQSQALENAQPTVVPSRHAAVKRLERGTLLDGRYQIEKMLGSGGAALVYLAHDAELDEPVAIKVFGYEADDAEAFERLRNEIRIARRLTHPNILRTHDFGKTAELFYITMEYVHGFTLAKVLTNQGALPLSMAVLAAKQICWGLQAAHREGIIHRDLKAENVMINRRGGLKIMDFGIALALERSKAATGEEIYLPDKRTPTGALIGTPHYMAPEQICEEPLDERCDLYALGVLLYYMSTGVFPFESQAFHALLVKHLESPPPDPLILRPEMPQALRGLILKCLQKEREQRHRNVDEVLRELDQI